MTNDPMEAHFIGFQMWLAAVEKPPGPPMPDMPSSTAIIGVSVPNLTGGYSTMMPNHHITKPVLVGEIQDDGQFETVWETPGHGRWRCLVGLPARESKVLISDWRASRWSCGNYNVETRSVWRRRGRINRH